MHLQRIPEFSKKQLLISKIILNLKGLYKHISPFLILIIPMSLSYFSKSFFLSLLLCSFSCTEKTSTSYTNNAVSSAHPLATQAGLEMYQKGGNAFDAAVASGFALAVVEPSMSGIGGRLQAIYKSSDGNIAGVDASTEVPMNYVQGDEKVSYGYPTIGIPGVVAGLLALHDQKGNLSLQEVMAPATRFAQNGYELLPGEAKRQQMVRDKLIEFEGTRHHFLVQDSISYQTGEKIVQKDLAYVLQSISNKGKAGFYQGEVAQKMVDDFQKNGGVVTLEDLKNYEARESTILKGSFENHEIYSLYLPSYGAITIQILQILDHLQIPKDENEWAYAHARATELAYTCRQMQKDSTQLDSIISYDKAAQWAKQIRDNQPQDFLPMDDMPISWTAIDGHTTHLTAADQWGNVVALTQTIGPNMGSKVATKGLGFLYAVTLGGYLGKYKPGDRANSHISPTLIEKDGTTVLALGAAGGSRIVPAITQVTDRYIRQKHSLDTALLLPRVYPYQDSVWVENHSGIQDLNASFLGPQFPIKWISEPARFGRVHAIANINGTWIGAADPDWEGTTAYFPEDEE